MKLTLETIQTINLFEQLTGAKIKDCIKGNDLITFLVEEGNIKKALGKDNINLKRIEGILKKKVRLIAFSNDVVKFINNLLYPLKVDKIEKKEEIVEIYIKDTRIKGKVYGRSRENLYWIQDLVKKYHNIKEIKII
ncbi:MAG TPA: NusA-like transcription termination signal-binding factor [Candidatus Nanoarchaeia archaeon]|nr:NusA-like transcription termination signal-binding factor [Candidatus Nanoarchaeia archaeon]